MMVVVVLAMTMVTTTSVLVVQIAVVILFRRIISISLRELTLFPQHTLRRDIK